MLTAERIINTHIWELYRAIIMQPVLPPSLTWTRVNSLANDVILKSIPLRSMLYNMVHMVCTQQGNLTNDTMQYVWFALDKILTKVRTWQASSHTTWCFGIKRLAGPVFVAFVNRQPTKNLWSISFPPLLPSGFVKNFLTALQSIDNKIGSSHPRSQLAVRSRATLSHSHDNSGSRVVCMLPTLLSHGSLRSHPALEPRVTSCTPWSSTILSLSWQQPAAHAQHIPQSNILVCSAWCLWGLAGDVNTCKIFC